MADIKGTLRLFDLENPTTILFVRSVYSILTLGMLAALLIAYQKIKATKKLIYTESPPPFSEDAPATIITTIEEYDKGELIKLVRSTLISATICLFLHFKFGYVQPMAVQSILPLRNFYYNPLVQIHLFSKHAIGNLKRPFLSAVPFSKQTTAISSGKKPKLKKK